MIRPNWQDHIVLGLSHTFYAKTLDSLGQVTLIKTIAKIKTISLALTQLMTNFNLKYQEIIIYDQ